MTSYQPVLKRQQKHNYLPIVVGIFLLLVAVLIGYLVVTSAMMTTAELRNPLAVNPELKAVALYEGVAAAPSLAENPELSSFQRFMAGQGEVERNVLAENPELTAVQHYITASSKPRNELAVNPELSCYYRYVNK
jgi:hypothetical protein